MDFPFKNWNADPVSARMMVLCDVSVLIVSLFLPPVGLVYDQSWLNLLLDSIQVCAGGRALLVPQRTRSQLPCRSGLVSDCGSLADLDDPCFGVARSWGVHPDWAIWLQGSGNSWQDVLLLCRVFKACARRGAPAVCQVHQPNQWHLPCCVLNVNLSLVLRQTS